MNEIDRQRLDIVLTELGQMLVVIAQLIRSGVVLNPYQEEDVVRARMAYEDETST